MPRYYPGHYSPPVTRLLEHLRISIQQQLFMKNKAPHLNTEGGRDIATTGRRGIHAATEGGRGMKCTCATSAYTISQQRGKKENTPKVRSRLSLRGGKEGRLLISRCYGHRSNTEQRDEQSNTPVLQSVSVVRPAPLNEPGPSLIHPYSPTRTSPLRSRPLFPAVGWEVLHPLGSSPPLP